MYEDFLSNLPRKFTEVILSAFREEGKRWMENLPEIIGEIENSWRVKIKEPYPNLSYHYVAPCVSSEDESEAVVKISFPGEAETILGEMKTLKFIDGEGANKLLRFDEKRLAMLLEKLDPGENLKIFCRDDETKAVRIAIDRMHAFWRKPPANHDFPMLEKWFDGLNKAEKFNFAPEMVRRAQEYFAELNAASVTKVLLHGDFHHENILSATREPFLAIDPKGIIGNRGYDVSIFLINHARWLENEKDLPKKLDDAIGLFAQTLKITPKDLRRWAFAHSVLSAWWTFEENSDNWANELTFAEIWEV